MKSSAIIPGVTTKMVVTKIQGFITVGISGFKPILISSCLLAITPFRRQTVCSVLPDETRCAQRRWKLPTLAKPGSLTAV